MQVTFSPRALRDLRAIGDFIAFDNSKRAGTFIIELRAACESLASEGYSYPLLDKPKGYRRMPIGNYLAFYQVIDDSVRIVGVMHSARDLRDLRFD